MALLALTCTLLLSAPPQGLRTDEHLITSIPEDISLEGEPMVDPDGKSWPVVHEVVYGPFGSRVAYIGEREGKRHPVIGDEVMDAYHYTGVPTFDATGETVIIRVGNRTKKSSETWWVLVNGETIGKSDWIGAPAVSPDGTRIAYWTQPGAKIERGGAYNRSDQVLVVAQRKGKGWKFKKGAKWDDALSLEAPHFSADGSRVSTIAMDKGEWYVMQLTKKEKKLSKGDPMISDLAVDASGKSLAFTTMGQDSGGAPGFGAPPGFAMPGMKNVIKWGKATLGAKFDNVVSPVVSSDGKHIAYKAMQAAKMGIVLDDDEKFSEAFDYVHTPIFSPKAKRIAYTVTEGGELDEFYRESAYGDTMIRGGESFVLSHALKGRRKPRRGAKWLEVRHTTFSPDGEQLAYAARSEEGWTIVLEEEPGPYFDDVGPPRFSSDGAHLAHGARSERELWWRVRAVE